MTLRTSSDNDSPIPTVWTTALEAAAKPITAPGEAPFRNLVTALRSAQSRFNGQVAGVLEEVVAGEVGEITEDGRRELIGLVVKAVSDYEWQSRLKEANSFIGLFVEALRNPDPQVFVTVLYDFLEFVLPGKGELVAAFYHANVDSVFPFLEGGVGVLELKIPGTNEEACFRLERVAEDFPLDVRIEY
jgi:hypothetical protein